MLLAPAGADVLFPDVQRDNLAEEVRMRRSHLTLLMAAAALLLLNSPSLFAGTITFDDLADNGVGTLIANGYAGLNWNNFAALNTLSFGTPSGYQNGTVSAPNVAFNVAALPAAFSSGGNFTLNSGYFTGAWNDGLTITVMGLENGLLVDVTNFVVNTSGPTLETFNWSGINEVDFSSAGGTNHGYNNSGTQFALDNLVINAPTTTPEPGTLGMTGLGILAAFVLRRRFQGMRSVRSR
jgi:PEP-CTERM motif-containing protein